MATLLGAIMLAGQATNMADGQAKAPVAASQEQKGDAVPSGVSGPTMAGGLAQFFSADDYPVEAMRAGEQGRVVAHLTIDAQGRVQTCDVARSSGSASLDAATCRVAVNRVKFLPAHDAKGQPVASSYDLPVTWSLPDDGPEIDLVATQLVDGTGKPVCKLSYLPQSGGQSQKTSQPLDAKVCRDLASAITQAGGLPSAPVMFYQPRDPAKQ